MQNVRFFASRKSHLTISSVKTLAQSKHLQIYVKVLCKIHNFHFSAPSFSRTATDSNDSKIQEDCFRIQININ